MELNTTITEIPPVNPVFGPYFPDGEKPLHITTSQVDPDDPDPFGEGDY